MLTKTDPGERVTDAADAPRATDLPQPRLTPPTPGTCSSCFYGQTFARIGGPIPALIRLCRHDTPTMLVNRFGYTTDAAYGINWQMVNDDDWCGQGADAKTYGSFSPT